VGAKFHHYCCILLYITTATYIAMQSWLMLKFVGVCKANMLMIMTTNKHKQEQCACDYIKSVTDRWTQLDKDG